jgi:hypothetical protein
MDHSDLTVDHPLFAWASGGGWNECPEGVERPCVFCFERPLWIEPTAWQARKYKVAQWIVERLGGHMVGREHEIAGRSQPLSLRDVGEILMAVQASNPTAKIVSHWNGQGCYCMSVGVDLGTANEQPPGPQAPAGGNGETKS